jgi:hypothetical protein
MGTDGAPRLEQRDVASLGAERGNQVDGRFDVSGGEFIPPAREPANRITIHDGSEPPPNSAERLPKGKAA